MFFNCVDKRMTKIKQCLNLIKRNEMLHQAKCLKPKHLKEVQLSQEQLP